MKCGAVVVSWRDADITALALTSLIDAEPGFDHIVCIAQELSTEQLDKLQSLGPRVTVDAVDSNLGYCEAANRGINQMVEAGCDWVMMLNNDATIEPSCLERCLDVATSQNRVAALGPAVAFTDEPDKLWYGGGTFNSVLGYTRHRALGASSARPPATAPTDYVPGCCCLISAAAWRELGPYRDDYFMYCEDVEWCERAHNGGWICLYLGEVLCLHAVSATAAIRGELSLTPTSAYYLSRNSMRFALDTPSLARRMSRVAGVATIWAAHNARRLRGAPPKTASAYAQGFRDAFTGRMGPRAA